MNSARNPYSFKKACHKFVKRIKTFFLIAGMIVLQGIAWGQAVTIQNEPAPVKYYRMPDMPLPASYSTYSADVSINFSELSKTGFTKNNLMDTYLKLEGYKWVSKNGDVEIKANIGEFIIWVENRSTTRTKKKDKDGNEQIKTTYHIELKYSLPVALEVYNKEGKTLLDKYISTMSDTRTWISSSHNSMSDLDSYWRIERTTRLTTLHKEILKEGLNKILDMINTNFGYPLNQENARFETIGKKKHPEYEVFQENVEIIQTAFKSMDANKSLESVKKAVEPALAFYKAAAEKYKTGNKDQEKLKHICLYNQALAYYWLEDFAKAELYALALQKIDSKDKDAKRLLADIDYTRTSLQRANRSSRHNVVIGKT